jgi:hypothetical protein
VALELVLLAKPMGFFIFMTYLEKLKDPRWQKKRLEIMQRDDFKCKKCFSDEKQLHVHHNYYQFGTEIWDYPSDCYDTLCYDCHYETTEMTNEIKQVLKKARFRTLSEIRNILIMSELYSLDELVEFRKMMSDFLIDKGIEIEDGTPL